MNTKRAWVRLGAGPRSFTVTFQLLSAFCRSAVTSWFRCRLKFGLRCQAGQLAGDHAEVDVGAQRHPGRGNLLLGHGLPSAAGPTA